MSVGEVFRRRLRVARLARGLTVRGLAGRAGCSHPCIVYLESGRNYPTLGVAAKCARALGVSLDWLAGLTGDVPCVTSIT